MHERQHVDTHENVNSFCESNRVDKSVREFHAKQKRGFELAADGLP